MGEIRLLNGYYGKLHPDTIRDLVDRDGIRIYYDRRVHAFLDVASKTTKAFEVQSQMGFTGKGITIAVIDTGIHPHDDSIKPNNRIIGFADLVGNRRIPTMTRVTGPTLPVMRREVGTNRRDCT